MEASEELRLLRRIESLQQELCARNNEIAALNKLLENPDERLQQAKKLLMQAVRNAIDGSSPYGYGREVSLWLEGIK